MATLASSSSFCGVDLAATGPFLAPMAHRIAEEMPSEFDYTFTEDELNNILGYMENHHQHGSAPRPSYPDAMQTNGVPLQFQPHKADSLGQPCTSSHSGDSQSQLEDCVQIKQEPVLDTATRPPSHEQLALAGLDRLFPQTRAAAAAPGAALAQKNSGLADGTAPSEARSHTSTAYQTYGSNHKRGTWAL